MLRQALLIFLTLTIAIGGGAGSVWYALGTVEGLGALTVGGWTSFPDAGTPHADPYSKARVAREADLPLGAAEGLTFSTNIDSGGERLRRECVYRIEGQMPPARFWTLHVPDAAPPPVGSPATRPAALGSNTVVRESDSSVLIAVSRHPSPGNWLALAGSGPMTFVITLYDTPVASNENIAATELPQVLRIGCDG